MVPICLTSGRGSIYFRDADPDPHTHWSKKPGAWEAQNGAMEAMEGRGRSQWRHGSSKWRLGGGGGKHLDQWLQIASLWLKRRIRIHITGKSWIRIRIKVKSWIRLRIKVMRIRNPVFLSAPFFNQLWEAFRVWEFYFYSLLMRGCLRYRN